VAKQGRITNGDPNAAPSGWLVKTSQGYYTGNGPSSLETWTAFPKWAKVYHRQGWAQRMADRFGGQVVPVPKQVPPPARQDNSSEPLRRT
jgi:hypothetical protein